MPEFQFTARDRQGLTQTGVISASDPAAARQLLIDRGWTVEHVGKTGQSNKGHGNTDHGNTGQSGTPADPAERLTRNSSEELASHLADLTSSGLPLESGLKMLAEELGGQGVIGIRQRRQLSLLARRLEQGESLDEALSQQGAPPDLIAAVRGGMNSGQPGRALAEYVTYLRSISSLRGRVFLGLFYPLTLLAVSLVLVTFVMVGIVPQFAEIFEGFGVELPVITKMIMEVSAGMVKNGISFLIAMGLLILVVNVLLRLAPKHIRRRVILFIPGLGGVLQAVAMARFTHALAFLTDSRLPLNESLRLASRSADDALIVRTADVWAERLERGESLSDSARRIGGIPAEMLQSTQWQSDPDFFVRALHSMGEMYEARARILTYMLIALAEPVIVIVTGVFFLWVVVALFYPLIRLMNDLS
ncbi:MAG: hypothetical protein CMJ47_12065 [Planctomyces sp.]|nr:hypothetical protein [Planctomyces sp.]